MSTKPKLKLVPLPSGLAKLPKGAVFLGRGGEKLDQAKASPFDAWTHLVDVPDPGGWEPQLKQAGCAEYLYYAAPRDSAIAREILGVREAPKKEKKAPALRKLPKDVKPGTRVVCIRSREALALVENKIYIIEDRGISYVCVKEIPGWAFYDNLFRLAPEKKPRVQRSKRIGVMPKPELQAAVAKAERDASKFPEAFNDYAAEPVSPTIPANVPKDSKDEPMSPLEHRLLTLLFGKNYRSESLEVIRELAAQAVLELRPHTLAKE